MLSYVYFDTENLDAIKGFGRLIIVIGCFFFIYSIIAFTAFEDGLSSFKFVMILLSSIISVVLGFFLINQAVSIANKSLTQRKYNLIVYGIPTTIFSLIILFISELISCNQCIGFTILVIVGYIISICLMLLIYLWHQKKLGFDLNKIKPFGFSAKEFITKKYSKEGSTPKPFIQKEEETMSDSEFKYKMEQEINDSNDISIVNNNNNKKGKEGKEEQDKDNEF